MLTNILFVLKFLRKQEKEVKMLFVAVILLLSVLSSNGLVSTFSSKELILDEDPDIFRNVSQLISSKGYLVEDHTVVTDDGYLLSMQRISHGKRKKSSGKKEVVLLVHGLLGSSSEFVLNLENQSLGFILADQNYDVWMGNLRGNTYSRNHTKLKPDALQFWNFSFDEMAEYDLPALINYALNKTGQKDLIYIGYSQGTTTAFALLSQMPRYNQKIKLFVALAPVAGMREMKGPIRHLVPYADGLEWILNLFRVGEILPENSMTTAFCGSIGKSFCEDMMFSLYGNDAKQFNKTRMPVYTAHLPAGSSTKNLLHYAQLMSAKKFQKYDHGVLNLFHYFQVTPPEYNISRITTPTALFWSMNDNFVGQKDVKILEKKLKHLVRSYRIPLKEFNHLDFVLGVDARTLLYDEVLSTMKKFSKL